MEVTEDLENGKLRITEQSGYCAFPVGGDTYRACAHGRLYCSEKFCINQHLRTAIVPTPRDHRQLFESIYEDPEVRRFVVDMGVPVQLGVTSDPFPPIEATEQVTLKTMRLLAQAGIAWLITTKAPNRMNAEHRALTKATGSVVKCSFSVLNDARAAILEPGAPPPSVRLAAMREMKAEGIYTVVRLNPYLHGVEYDYDLLADACHGVVVEPLRFATPWRSQDLTAMWEVISGEKRPEGEYKRGSAAYKWAEQKERTYFGQVQDPSDVYHSGGIHWVISDSRILREVFSREREKAKARGLTFGICSLGQGIHNIDLNEAPYCCCVNPMLGYDRWALVPQWHVDQWAAFRCRACQEIDLDLATIRMTYANAPSVRPLVMGGGTNGEPYFSGYAGD
jgi:DNA repair photolyase